MAKKLDKKRLNKLISSTSKIYSKACAEVGFSIEKLLIQRTYAPKDGGITDSQYREAREKLDTLYCKYLCELDTETLEDLLVAHVKCQVIRAPRTLDIVEKELLERTISEDEKRDIG